MPGFVPGRCWVLKEHMTLQFGGDFTGFDRGKLLRCEDTSLYRKKKTKYTVLLCIYTNTVFDRCWVVHMV